MKTIRFEFWSAEPEAVTATIAWDGLAWPARADQVNQALEHVETAACADVKTSVIDGETRDEKVLGFSVIAGDDAAVIVDHWAVEAFDKLKPRYRTLYRKEGGSWRS